MAIDLWADTIQTVALVFVAAASAVGVRQVRLARYGGGGANLLSLWVVLQSDDAVDDRRRVHEAFEHYGAFDTAHPESWPEDRRAIAGRVASLWSVTGALAARDIIPLDFIIDEWGGTIQRTWRICEPICEYERARRATPELWTSFQLLAYHAARRGQRDMRSQKRRRPIIG